MLARLATKGTARRVQPRQHVRMGYRMATRLGWTVVAPAQHVRRQRATMEHRTATRLGWSAVAPAQHVRHQRAMGYRTATRLGWTAAVPVGHAYRSAFVMVSSNADCCSNDCNRNGKCTAVECDSKGGDEPAWDTGVGDRASGLVGVVLLPVMGWRWLAHVCREGGDWKAKAGKTSLILEIPHEVGLRSLTA